jgi:hypothetical protein
MSEEGYIGLAKQVASGTYVTPASYMYVKSCDIGPETDLMIPDAEIGSNRDITEAYVGPVKYTGKIDFNLRPNAFGYLLLGATGACTSSGIAGQTGAYGHNFTFENDLIPLSIEKKIGDGLENFGYSDSKVNSLHLECAAGEFVTGSTDIIAISETSGKVVQTTTFGTDPILTYDGGSVKLDGGEVSVKSLSFDIANNIVDDDFRLGGRKLATLIEKRRELKASLEIVPQDSTTFKKTYYGSDTGTTASGTGVQDTYSGSLFLHFLTAKSVANGLTQKYEMDIIIPKAYFQTAPINPSGDDMIVETLEMLPVKGSSAIGTIVLRNGKSSY